jgi:hypothetical protein
MLVQRTVPGSSLLPRLEAAKERISYAKFWLGAMVGTGVLVIIWWLSIETRDSLFLQIDCAAVLAATTVGIVLIHRRIMREIAALKDL